MVSIKQIVFVAAAAAGSAPLAAHAADMSFTPPIIAEEAIPQEIGSGWYLRGDVGYSVAAKPSISFPADQTVGLSNVRTSNQPVFGIGVGYKFNEWLRADVTADFLSDRKINWSRTGGCYGMVSCPSDVSNSATQSMYPFLANLYLDLGNYAGFTPYVGGGLGVAFIRTRQANYSQAAFADATPGATYIAANDITFATKERFSFAAAAMAGFSYDLGSGIALDAGYKYLYLDKSDAAPGRETITTVTNANPNANPATAGSTSTRVVDAPGAVQFRDHTFHQFRVGLRYYLN